MRIPILVLGAAVALASCSTFSPPDVPVCDGRHRRPANLYGSVLDPALGPATSEEADTVPHAVAPAEDQTPVLPAPASAPGGCA